VRVFNSNFVGHCQYFREPSGVDAGIGAGFSQRREHLLGGNIPHQIVSRKWAAAKPCERACQSDGSPPGTQQGFSLPRSPAGCADEHRVRFPQRDLLPGENRSPTICGEAVPNGIRQRKQCARECLSANPEYPGTISGPHGLIVRIAECHGDVDDQTAIRSGGSPLQGLDQRHAILRESYWHLRAEKYAEIEYG